MKELVIGTSNPAKVEQIRGALAPIDDLQVVGVNDKSLLPQVVKDGKTPQENARKKSMTFAKALGTTVLSMDNALYFDDLEGDERQPGLNVRRFAGVSRPTDNEMKRYYQGLVKELGGNVKARWEYGVCISSPDGKDRVTSFGYPTVFVSEPSEKTMEGYPLESLQIDEETGKYRSEMTTEELDGLWQKKIGEPLQRFVLDYYNK